MQALIDDLQDPEYASNGARWQVFSDGVMGGASRVEARHTNLAGRSALLMTGVLSLENNGGFIQIALDLDANGNAVDARAFGGIAITVRGDGGSYGAHLRTTDVQRPWQSYRASFIAHSEWQRIELPFARFQPHRITSTLNTARLRRLGLVAIGRSGPVELAVADLRFYRS